MTEEKQLKSKLRSQVAELHIKTKSVIEGLSDDEVNMLLEKKWIEPLLTGIRSIPRTIIDVLVTKVRSLTKKYETTFSEIENELHETEAALGSMMKKLTGSNHDLKGLEEFMSLLGVR